MTETAKLFKNGRSQAVRLPAQFRFEGEEVFIRRDPVTGDVVLSERHPDWDRFFSLLEKADVPEDFLSPEERDQGSQDRDPLEEVEE